LDVIRRYGIVVGLASDSGRALDTINFLAQDVLSRAIQPLSKAEFNRLIKDLAAKPFQTRERASKTLRARTDERDLPRLWRAERQTSDLEVIRRISRTDGIIENIEKKVTLDTKELDLFSNVVKAVRLIAPVGVVVLPEARILLEQIIRERRGVARVLAR